MIKKFFQILLCFALVMPAHAGQGTIEETDTQIIIEYSGGEDDVKAAKVLEAERESQRQAEQAEMKKKEKENELEEQRREKENTLQEQKLEKAKRKGDLKRQQYEKIQ